MTAGAVTGFMISFVETPIDLVKTKLQIQIFGSKLNPLKFKSPVYTTLSECVKYTTQKHGIKALWQGLGATMVRNIPANSLFFPVSELIKMEFSQRTGTPMSGEFYDSLQIMIVRNPLLFLYRTFTVLSTHRRCICRAVLLGYDVPIRRHQSHGSSHAIWRKEGLD
jgi:Mitochondrial carrier protein